jgi:hypothetical protein
MQSILVHAEAAEYAAMITSFLALNTKFCAPSGLCVDPFLASNRKEAVPIETALSNSCKSPHEQDHTRALIADQKQEGMVGAELFRWRGDISSGIRT